jgi:hypothetical protein
MNKYKIIEKTYFNERGKPNEPRYYIKELKSVIPLFGWKRWVYIKETHYDYECHHYKTRMVWNTAEDAQEFINTVLCPGVLRDKYQIKEIQTVKCND